MQVHPYPAYPNLCVTYVFNRKDMFKIVLVIVLLLNSNRTGARCLGKGQCMPVSSSQREGPRDSFKAANQSWARLDDMEYLSHVYNWYVYENVLKKKNCQLFWMPWLNSVNWNF